MPRAHAAGVSAIRPDSVWTFVRFVLDTAILTRLHEAGLRLVIVADPHQAIYEYEGATPGALAKLTDTVPQPLRLNLYAAVVCDLW